MPKISSELAQTSRNVPVSHGWTPWPARLRLLGMAVVWIAVISMPGEYGGYAWGANAESTEAFAQAQKALKDGEANEAMIHLKNAVRIDPDNIDARFLLGQFNLQRGDIAGAEKEFREARRRGMDDDKVLPLLAQALLGQGKAKELLAEISMDKLQGATRVTGYTLRARAYLVTNEIPKAKAELELARPLAESIASFHAADAEVLQREGNFEAAEKAIDRAIEIDPKFSLALWLKGELRRVQKDLPGSLEAYNRALEVDKSSMQVLIGRAFVLLGLNRFEEAETDVDAILKRAPEMPMALYIKSALLSQKGEAEKALETLQPVEFRISSFMPAVYLLATLNLKLDRLEGAVSYAERYHAANEGKPDAIKLLSAVYLRQKRYPDAIKLLKPHEAEDAFKGDTYFLQLLGNSYLAISDYPSASRVFKSLQVLKPEDQTIREQLAITSLGMGEQDEAVRELEAMAEGKGGSDRVNLLLILTHMRNKEYVKAEAAAQNYVKQGENNATALNLLGSVLLAQDKRPEARASFDAALKADPGFSPAVLNLAQLYRVENNAEGAKSILKAHLEKEKGDEKVLTQLADIAISEGDMNGALTWLLAAVAENPKSEPARLRLIDQQLKLKKLEAALQSATDLAAIAPNSPAALNALAQVQILNKQVASGIATYRKLTDVVPKAPRGHLLLGQALILNGNLDEAGASFDEAIKLAPNLPDARAERIGLELKNSGIEAATKLAEKYRDEMPENPILHILLGDVYLRAENYAGASASFEKAQQLRPGGNTLRRLYVAQVRDNKQDAAFAGLLAWAKANPEDWETRLMLSTELIRRGDAQAAIAENEALNEKFPGRPVILNNLGWLYARKGDARGVELVRTAYELAPKSGEIQDTYGWLLVKESKLKQGLEVLVKAAAALPKSAEVQYH
ncbi:MAG: XrtA/PEP-CTERM system TPR-repeat protein PrsT, partial [Alphaproteobacteria bacterium]